ncbi:MAG: 4-(cytidine 5'-diphospho)-2-C-methyl-D-erythritol kinase [candidate division Zixibacteria bacterium]|nr:4-(cytidine 5'-diphospho)-2-C-methyl-D-erythritol kinase [candidate division Zixibacteria bacterium]
MRTRCEIWAPAKLNLGLSVLGRRMDGYHDILTRFVAVDLYDQLVFTRRISGGVSLHLQDVSAGVRPEGFPLDEGNLILKAVRLVERETGIRASLSVSIRKAIPIAAGLGGGSADAAAALLAMTRLYDIRVSRQELGAWGSQLGADIPFFLGESAALGRGRGDELSPIALFRQWWVILVTPPVFVSAKDVYGDLRLTLGAKAANFDDCRDREGFLAALRRSHNDLEAVVLRRAPEILLWQGRLREQGAAGVFVSGSGPTVFGVYMNQPPEETVQSLRGGGTGARVVVARPVTTPLALVVQ